MQSSVIVLAGGTSRRFGADKTSQPFGTSTVLGHLVDSVPRGWPVVVVGVPTPLPREVVWTRETPPGGGPLAAMTAGFSLVTTDLAVVVAGDMPFGGRVCQLLADELDAEPDVDAVAARRGAAHSNPLLAAYRVAAARLALPADCTNLPARLLLTALRHLELLVDDDAALGVDTPEALAQARRRLRA
ncbi:NTP transferase domain-containing protein [Lapillicoccus sp.]|uniref:molybdenum cofactor guanylyltransferase n=1 Tax=Lapillicoccus sp. TaxID=1909287 RepID=UPI0027C78FCD|nr:NTP transferase domain-containing protein [Actinomycetota bacterium]